MHDSTLRRTTNVKEVYPNDTAQNAALFPWDTLQELNAGTWFLKVSAIKDHHQLDVEETPAGYYFITSILGEDLPVEPKLKEVSRNPSVGVSLLCPVSL